MLPQNIEGAIIAILTKTLQNPEGTFYNNKEKWFRIPKNKINDNEKIIFVVTEWLEINAIVQTIGNKTGTQINTVKRLSFTEFTYIIKKSDIKQMNDYHFSTIDHGQIINIYLPRSTDWMLRGAELQKHDL